MSGTAAVTEINQQTVEVQAQGPTGPQGASVSGVSYSSTGTITVTMNTGATFSATPTGLTLSGPLVALNGAAYFGPSSGSALDSAVYRDQTNFYTFDYHRNNGTTYYGVQTGQGVGWIASLVAGLAYTWRINNADRLVLNSAGRMLIGGATLVGGGAAASPLTVMDLAAGNARNGAAAIGGDPTSFGSLRYTHATGVLDLGSLGIGASVTVSTVGTVRATIDAGGNVGIGATPSAWGAGINALQTKGACLYSSTTGNVVLGQNFFSDGTNSKALTTNPASFYAQSGGVHQWLYSASTAAGANITWLEAMRLDGSGNLLVGTTSNSQTLPNGANVINTGAGTQINVGHANGTASGTAYHVFAFNSGIIGSITQSGTTAVLYNTTSDARLKENVTPAPDAGELVDAIQIRSFDWIADGSHQRYGVVAQELAAVAPEAVHQPEDPEAMMAVDYSKLVPVLVKEIQSLRARVAALEAA